MTYKTSAGAESRMEVLGSADLSQDAFDNLSQVSDILMEMKRRLG